MVWPNTVRPQVVDEQEIGASKKNAHSVDLVLAKTLRRARAPLAERLRVVTGEPWCSSMSEDRCEPRAALVDVTAKSAPHP